MLALTDMLGRRHLLLVQAVEHGLLLVALQLRDQVLLVGLLRIGVVVTRVLIRLVLLACNEHVKLGSLRRISCAVGKYHTLINSKL